MLYVGGLEKSRGLEVCAGSRARWRPASRGQNRDFAGRGEGVESGALAAYLGVLDRVRISRVGAIRARYRPSSDSADGVCPEFVTEHTQTTCRTRHFRYMWQERPVIVTNANAPRDLGRPEAARRLHDTSRPWPRRLADSGSGPGRRAFGLAGRRAVLDRTTAKTSAE